MTYWLTRYTDLEQRQSLSVGRKNRIVFTMKPYGFWLISMQRQSNGVISKILPFGNNFWGMQPMLCIKLMLGKSFLEVPQRHLVPSHMLH